MSTKTAPLSDDIPAERRRGLDRRQPPIFPPRFSGQRRRSSKGRRKTDRGGYVDIYDRKSWVIALSVMGLSFLDAVLTAFQIRRGMALEANPIMNLAIEWGGMYAFFSLKAAMTAFPLAVIILHKEWLLARQVAHLCIGFYIVILLYHLYLVGSFNGILPAFI